MSEAFSRASVSSVGSSVLVDLEENAQFQCENVKFDGRQGSLSLTLDTITFTQQQENGENHDDDNGNDATPCTWDLSLVTSYTVSAVTSTIKLRLQGETSCLSFQLESLPKLVQLRKALVPRLVRIKQLKEQQQQKDEIQKATQDRSSYPPQHSPKQAMYGAATPLQRSVNAMSHFSLLDNTDDMGDATADDDAPMKVIQTASNEEESCTCDHKQHNHHHQSTEEGDIEQGHANLHTQSKEGPGNHAQEEEEEGVATYSSSRRPSSKKPPLSTSIRRGSHHKPCCPRNRRYTSVASQARMSDISMTSEEAQDDINAREILQMTQQQTSGQDTMEAEKRRTQHNLPTPPTCTSNNTQTQAPLSEADAKRQTLLNLPQQQRGGEAVTTACSTTTTTSPQQPNREKCNNNNVVHATEQVVPSEATATTTVPPQRGPGAYSRAPGQGSSRNVSLNYDVVGCRAASGADLLQESAKSIIVGGVDEEEETAPMDGSDSTYFRRRISTSGNGGGRIRRSSFFDASSAGTIVEACLVVEEDDARKLTTVMPSCVEVKDEEEEIKLERYKTATLVGGSCGCLLIAVIIMVIVIMSVTNNNNNSNPDLGSPLDRRAAILHLTKPLVADVTDWDDPRSPANLALEWLADKDPLELNLNLQQHDKIRQRFLLTLFYFHTTRYSRESDYYWRTCNPPQTGENRACVHKKLESYGVQGEYFDQHMTEPSFRWMSDTDECRWAGVRCTDGIHVSHIQLGGYGLTGTLPVELNNLRYLTVLDLQQNKLEGQLPPEYMMGSTVDSPSMLQVLRLDRNRFSGTIPEEWCMGTTTTSDEEPLPLETWNLDVNLLEGPLPSCLDNLQQLKDFSASHNFLTGTVPALPNSTNLERLHLSFNSLQGSVPESFCEIESMTELSADCLDSAGNFFVECSCCSKCCGREEEPCEVYTAGEESNNNGE